MKIRRRCKCGCGEITNPGNKYINHHHVFGNTNMKGKHHSKKTKRKIGMASKERKPSKETRKKMSISKMGNTNPKGCKHSEETKLKMAISKIKCDPNYEYCGSWKDGEYKKDLRKDYCENRNCKKNYSRLDNHHIDLNKKNCKPVNIMTLCHNCHMALHNRLRKGDFLIINRLDHITYINKKVRNKIIMLRR